MNDMAKKPETKKNHAGQMTLFDELFEDKANSFQRQYNPCNESIFSATANQAIFRQGEKPDCVFEIISGTLKLSQVTENGRQVILGFPSSGELIGLTGGNEHSYTAETLTAARFRSVLWEDFHTQLIPYRSTSDKLLGWLDAHEKMAQEHISVLALQSPLAKLAAFLLERIAHQKPETTEDGVIVDLPMTQRDIAIYLAIAPETCSRSMKKLLDEGIVEARGRSGNGQWIKIQYPKRLNDLTDGA